MPGCLKTHAQNFQTTGCSILLGGRAWLDPEINTPAELKAGKLSIDFDLEPPAPLDRLTFRARRNDGYYEELVNAVSLAA